MLKEKSDLINGAHKLLDIGLTASAFVLAYFIKKYFLPGSFRGLHTGPNYYIILLLIIIAWYLIFNALDLYSSYRKKTLGNVLWETFKAVSYGLLAVILCLYVFKMDDVSRIMIGLFYGLNLGLLFLSKGVVYHTLRHFRRKGFNFRNILVVGSNERAKRVLQSIDSDKGSGYRILGCLEQDSDAIGEKIENGFSVIGTTESLPEVLETTAVDEIIFATPLRDIKNIKKHLALAEDLGVLIRILPEWHLSCLDYKPNLSKINFEDFFGMPTMKLQTTPQDDKALLIKSFLDFTIALVLIVLLFPVGLIAAICIKAVSRGPVFYRQNRCGLNGRNFTVYKFRTMVCDAENQQTDLLQRNECDGPVFKIKNDPRIIPYIGRFLRKTGIDELPQLLNVIRGEMSIVGPRPPIPDEVKEYDIWQKRRLSMKPGLTCLWQTTPCRNEIPFREWMNMDLKYIDNWTLGLDFKILLKTALVVIRGDGR